mmetsp:Transcript_30396/g.64116  ORF Transcript_30396/g.64116 Transcript_30396/m.64116 type:complete len:380 (-) Transcript_30396:963-2102(-)
MKLLTSPLITARFGLLVGAVTLSTALSGYCNWGPAGTGASSVCDGDVQGGDTCNEGQSNCEDGCGGRWCTNDGGPAPPTPTPPTGGQTATTTRYWDCSGGACACAYIPTGFSDQEPAHCHSNAMFVAPAGNPFGATYYGAAAVSASLGGGNWMADACGKCWKVTGTSNAPGYGGVETTLILKGTNFCPDDNPLCDAGPHFDIAAPGFDVTAYSLAHTCPEREPEEAAGFAACETWLIGNLDPDLGCDCSLFNSPTLRRGCENFYNLKWDNPVVTYEEVSCPPELADLHCEHPYALEANMPETCSSNDYSAPSTTSTTTTESPPTTSTTTTTTTEAPPTTTTTTVANTTTSTSTTTEIFSHVTPNIQTKHQTNNETNIHN